MKKKLVLPLFLAIGLIGCGANQTSSTDTMPAETIESAEEEISETTIEETTLENEDALESELDLESQTETEGSNDFWITADIDMDFGMYEAMGDIVSFDPLEESKNNLTEAEIIALFKEKGFETDRIEYFHSESGEEIEGGYADENSDAVHPMYYVNYADPNGVWDIYYANGTMYATSWNATINNHSGYVTDKGYISPYIEKYKGFISIIPDTDIKTIDEISAETINGLDSSNPYKS